METPLHYTYAGVECRQLQKAMVGKEQYASHCLCTALKYLYRCGKKQGNPAIQDLKKCRDYIDWAIESLSEHDGMP